MSWRVTALSWELAAAPKGRAGRSSQPPLRGGETLPKGLGSIYFSSKPAGPRLETRRLWRGKHCIRNSSLPSCLAVWSQYSIYGLTNVAEENSTTLCTYLVYLLKGSNQPFYVLLCIYLQWKCQCSPQLPESLNFCVLG